MGFGVAKTVVAGIVGFYGNKAVTLLATQKPIENLLKGSAWAGTAVNVAAAATAFALAAIGKMTGIAKGDTGSAVLLGGLLYAVNRGIETSSVVKNLSSGFTKDLLSDYVMDDGSDGWDGQIDADLQPSLYGQPFLADYDMADYEFEV